jgi:hypothetical protein
MPAREEDDVVGEEQKNCKVEEDPRKRKRLCGGLGGGMKGNNKKDKVEEDARKRRR